MEGLMNVGSLVLGLIAWILPAVNVAQHNKISNKRYAAYTVTSLSSCATALCLQLFYTDHLVKIEDWSALLDTSHATALVATLLLVVTIIHYLCTLEKIATKIEVTIFIVMKGGTLPC